MSFRAALRLTSLDKCFSGFLAGQALLVLTKNRCCENLVQGSLAPDLYLYLNKVVLMNRWCSCCLAKGGGLLIHPDLFAQIYFQLFCLRYVLLSCTEMPPFAIQCSARVQHKTANFPAL